MKRINHLLSVLLAGSLLMALAPAAHADPVSSATGIVFDVGTADPGQMVVSGDGAFIYAFGAQYNGQASHIGLVYKINAADFSIVATYQMAQDVQPFAMAISPDSQFLYLVSYNFAKVAKLKTSDLSFVSQVALPGDAPHPLSMLVDAAGAVGYVASEAGKIVRINLAGDMSVTGELTLTSPADAIYAGLLNPAGDVAYFVSTVWTSAKAPTLFKVALTGDMAEVSHVSLNVGDGYVTSLLPAGSGVGVYVSANGAHVNVNFVNLQTGAITKTTAFPEGLLYASNTALTADKKSIVSIASNDTKAYLLRMSLTDQTLLNQIELPAAQFNAWLITVNPVTGAVYHSYAPTTVDGQPAPAGIAQAAKYAPPVAAKVPSAPQKVKVAYAVKQATFTWSSPSTDGGAAVAKYQYCLQKCNLRSSWKSVTARKFVKTGWSKGQSGTIQVRAVNSVGAGPVARLKYKQSK